MKCDVCGFEMGNVSNKKGVCLGCGTPMVPAEDHTKPAPGFDVIDKPYTVTDEDREHDPRLEDRFIILESDIKWGRGIGAETYGYYQKRLREIVRTAAFTDEKECPECGDDRAYHASGFDGCVAGYDRLLCNSCDHEYYDEFWC